MCIFLLAEKLRHERGLRADSLTKAMEGTGCLSEGNMETAYPQFAHRYRDELLKYLANLIIQEHEKLYPCICFHVSVIAEKYVYLVIGVNSLSTCVNASQCCSIVEHPARFTVQTVRLTLHDYRVILSTSKCKRIPRGRIKYHPQKNRSTQPPSSVASITPLTLKYITVV